MKRLAALFLLGGLVALQSCGVPGTLPTPTPSPVPSPRPGPLAPFNPPLGVAGGRFVDAGGQDARLMGAAGCCSDPAWPFASVAFLERIAAAGANWTTIRCGPLFGFGWFGNDYISGDETYRQYITVNGKADLSRFDPVYFVRVRAILQKTFDLREYTELDLVDGWTLERSFAHPWARQNNIQGFSGGDCSILSRAPHGYAIAFVRRLVHETGMFPHVVYQIGNETFDCGGQISEAWERGIVEAVRAQESVDRYHRHLVGSNAYPTLQEQPWADYESWHQPAAAPPGPPGKDGSPYSRPRQVNEYGRDLTPEQWAAEARVALANGGAFHYWLGDSTEATIDATLAQMTQIRRE